MVVSVNFLGLQRSLTRTDRVEVRLPGQGRVTDVLSHIRECFPDLPLEDDAFLVMVNDRVATLDAELQHNDTVSFLPHLGGG